MPENANLPDARELLRHAYNTVPRRRFWKTVVLATSLGALIALPFIALLLFHEGPWTGLVWDFLFRLPLFLICVALVGATVKSVRERKWKEALQGGLVVAFFGSITFLGSLEFSRQLKGLVHFHRIEQVNSVTVECHTTTDPALISQIIADLREAEWYSPMSHGWAPYASLTLRFIDGHSETYGLTKILAEGRLVVRAGEGSAGLLAFEHLRVSMQRAGLLSVASYPRYDNKGFYEAIVPPSVCKQSK